jgi:iron(III) transport system permease protein
VQRLLLALCVLMALPVAGVFGSWLVIDAAAIDVLRRQWDTVLPGYVANSLLLAACVAIGTAIVGAATAAAVSLFEFRGRRFFEWALLLPLAMPAYVLAYAATDFLQYSAPLQSGLRALIGTSKPLWPDVRSLPGAIVLFVLCLYPYVYLLTRAALAERGVPLMEAARMLGAGMGRRVREVALPLARPAIVAGVALALMETLADYGVGSYFGLSTFTTGIYKAWLVMGDQAAAAQLASLLLLLVALALMLEKRAQRRLRFAARSAGAAHAADARAVRLEGGRQLAAQALCALPVLLGFVLPVAVLIGLAAGEWRHAADAGLALPLQRFAGWAITSLKLAGIASLLAAALALALAFAMRMPGARGRPLASAGALLPAPLAAVGGSSAGLALAARTVSLGYAVPGAVIAVGILMTMGWLQTHWPAIGASAIVTGSVFGLLYAYMVRFAAVALQSVEAGYARVPASLDETARMLGARRAGIFFGVHLPLLKRSVLVAMLLVFVDVMKELPATLVLRPFDTDTLAVVAYQLARDERLGEAALPSLAIVLVGLLPVILLARGIGQTPAR